MSRTSDALKRKVAQADASIDDALVRVKEVHQAFEPVHPELVGPLELVAKSLMLGQEMLRIFWGSSWGGNPDNMDTYLSQPRKRDRAG